MDHNTKILLGSLLVGAGSWLIVLGIADDRFLAEIYNYQTLIAAGLALIGAFVTWRVMG
jgi:hypothetical protein